MHNQNDIEKESERFKATVKADVRCSRTVDPVFLGVLIFNSK